MFPNGSKRATFTKKVTRNIPFKVLWNMPTGINERSDYLEIKSYQGGFIRVISLVIYLVGVCGQATPKYFANMLVGSIMMETNSPWLERQLGYWLVLNISNLVFSSVKFTSRREPLTEIYQCVKLAFSQLHKNASADNQPSTSCSC